MWGDEVLELGGGEGLHHNVNVISATEPTHGYNGKYYVLYILPQLKKYIYLDGLSGRKKTQFGPTQLFSDGLAGLN